MLWQLFHPCPVTPPAECLSLHRAPSGCLSPCHLLRLFPAVPRARAVGDGIQLAQTLARAWMDGAILGAAG